MNMIELMDVYKDFNSHRVLQGINLSVNKGETMVVIGGSGSGKSVLMKHVIGLLKPDSGKVMVDGRDLTTMSEKEFNDFRRKFGMLFQYAALFDSLTVWENVGFTLLEHTKLPPKEVRQIASEKLAMVGLKGIEDRMPAELSGGMKKRVGLARAIATEPQILLYDEPTTGLDPISADAINDLIVELKQKLKVTGLAITHDMKSAYKIGDHVAMLYKGHIITVGTPDEIKNSPDPLVQQFITGSAVGPITAD